MFLFAMRFLRVMFCFYKLPLDVVKERRHVKSAVHKGYVWSFQNPEWLLQKKWAERSTIKKTLLLMEEILHHLGCKIPFNQRDKLPISWCRISSINSETLQSIICFFKCNDSGKGC